MSKKENTSSINYILFKILDETGLFTEKKALGKGEADVIMEDKNGDPWFFEIKQCSWSNGSLFDAATITQWYTWQENKGRYYFVFIKGSQRKRQFAFVKPEDLMEYSSIPPFKIYFNLHKDQIIDNYVGSKCFKNQVEELVVNHNDKVLSSLQPHDYKRVSGKKKEAAVKLRNIPISKLNEMYDELKEISSSKEQLKLNNNPPTMALNPYLVTPRSIDSAGRKGNQEDPIGVAQYIRELKLEFEKLAHNYLKRHPKTDYYYVKGVVPEINLDHPLTYILPYTQAEIQQIKELLVVAWNKRSDSQVASYEEINLGEYYLLWGCNKELDNLLSQKAKDCGFNFYSIDLSNPVHAYQFSAWEYEKCTNGQKKDRRRRLVILTDEEYLYLLIEHLFDANFSFNRLLLCNAPLAQKICESIDEEFLYKDCSPYLILMDEVNADVDAILEQKLKEINRSHSAKKQKKQ